MTFELAIKQADYYIADRSFTHLRPDGATVSGNTVVNAK